ncbi:hypothetical protein FEDK69T_24760 [Flavobacterium enshiense DK69]|nr:type I restriction enzyme HsdR N-terminal domain-containing protein [Flavobacterium enshiense]ESU21409.1 hypothetical protein FEDK69T_24760 [Flavobacterium enshiense DK69]
MNKEKWEEICFLLSESIVTAISESDFEQNIIQALRVLNWKAYSGDFQIRPSFHIGASNRITPDIVINSPEKRNLFVIEIKQPNIQLNTKFQQQLFSYMRQLKLEYGVLIGQEIQIFYDGDLTEHEDPVLLETIEFEKESEKGVKFVELFSKENFSYDSLKIFTQNSLDKINRGTEQKILWEKILSPDYELKVLELIKLDFLNKYDGEIIDNVLQGLSVNITAKNTTENGIPKIQENIYKQFESKNTKDHTRYIINGMGTKLAKNRFVLEFIRAFLKENPLDFRSLKNVFRDEYQGSTGVINKLELVETKYANKSNKRHFTGNEDILTSSDNVKFVVSTEWGKGNIENIVDLARKKGFKIEEV